MGTNSLLLSLLLHPADEGLTLLSLPSPVSQLQDFSLYHVNISAAPLINEVPKSADFLESFLKNYCSNNDDIGRESRVLAKRIELREKMNKSPLRHRKVVAVNGCQSPVVNIRPQTPQQELRHHSMCTQTEIFHVSVGTQTDIEISPPPRAISCSSLPGECNASHSITLDSFTSESIVAEVIWDLDFHDIERIYESDPFIFAGLRWKVTFGRYNEKGFGMYLTLAQRDHSARVLCEFKVSAPNLPTYSRHSNGFLEFPANNMVFRGFREYIGAEVLSYVRGGKLQLSVVMSTPSAALQATVTSADSPGTPESGAMTTNCAAKRRGLS